MKKGLTYLKQAHAIFAVIALVSGVIFISIIPPFWGLDESTHFNRTYQYGERIWSFNEIKSGVPQNVVSLEKYAVRDIANSSIVDIFSRKDVDSADAYRVGKAQHFSKENAKAFLSAEYSPIAYVGPIVGVVVAHILNANIGQTIFLERLLSLLLYIAIIWFALRILQKTKIRWLILVIALLPTSLFLATVITADGMAIGLALLFTSLLIRLLKSENTTAELRSYFYILAIVAILLPLVKLNYIFLSLGTILVPLGVLKTKRQTILVKYGSMVLAGLLTLAWAVHTKVTSTSPSIRSDGITVVVSDQISNVIHGPLHFIFILWKSCIANSDTYLTHMIASMGWNSVVMPLLIIFTLSLALLLAGLFAKKELVKIRKQLSWLGLSILVGVVSIFFVFYVVFTPAGRTIIEGVQGRYFVPFLAPIVMLITSVLPFDIKMKDKTAPYVFGGVMSVSLLLSIVYYWMATY